MGPLPATSIIPRNHSSTVCLNHSLRFSHWFGHQSFFGKGRPAVQSAASQWVLKPRTERANGRCLNKCSDLSPSGNGKFFNTSDLAEASKSNQWICQMPTLGGIDVTVTKPKQEGLLTERSIVLFFS
ncbi:unnamed protein product [Linum trigynum]|uniref:Uncharacterized protein n=1 Tax=Linum trigynum TaxID=586398 RepID=A0AAV2G5S2_9ROSI